MCQTLPHSFSTLLPSPHCCLPPKQLFHQKKSDSVNILGDEGSETHSNSFARFPGSLKILFPPSFQSHLLPPLWFYTCVQNNHTLLLVPPNVMLLHISLFTYTWYSFCMQHSFPLVSLTNFYSLFKNDNKLWGVDHLLLYSFNPCYYSSYHNMQHHILPPPPTSNVPWVPVLALSHPSL